LKTLAKLFSDMSLTEGETPCLVSETGIPFDMDDKKAYDDGDYTNQCKAMDANNWALEKARLSYTLWTYCPPVLLLKIFSNRRIIIYGVMVSMARISVSGVNKIRKLHLRSGLD
jgi:hypothetical protein